MTYDHLTGSPGLLRCTMCGTRYFVHAPGGGNQMFTKAMVTWFADQHATCADPQSRVPAVALVGIVLLFAVFFGIGMAL